MNETSKQLFVTIHAEYQAMVTQMCLGFVKGDKEMANDLTQDVFVNIWSALAGYRGDASMKTWIYRITVNTCLQYIRKEKNRQTLPVLSEEHPDLAATGSDYTELYKAIGQLNEIDRLIIMMVLDELEYSEIAIVVGINESNLRVKIHRVKLKLKKILEHAS